MNILTDKYFKDYQQQLKIDVDLAMIEIDNIELNPKSFTFYTSVAVISSSRIEGEQMEIDSFVKHKMQDIEYMPDLIEKPNDLYMAYLYAQKNKLDANAFLEAHFMLSQHLLPERWRGKYRKNEMLVMEHRTGNVQFEAAPFNIVEDEMGRLWNDIDELSNQKLSMKEVFYFASLIHLVFVTIHPFNDGNGRAGRLLEKWFLAEHLGEKVWYIKSEKYYYHHVNEYYKNLSLVGMYYEQIDYSKANRFLQMLPHSINYKE